MADNNFMDNISKVAKTLQDPEAKDKIMQNDEINEAMKKVSEVLNKVSNDDTKTDIDAALEKAGSAIGNSEAANAIKNNDNVKNNLGKIAKVLGNPEATQELLKDDSVQKAIGQLSSIFGAPNPFEKGNIPEFKNSTENRRENHRQMSSREERLARREARRNKKKT